LILKFSDIVDMIRRLIDFDSLAEFIDPPTTGNLFAPIDKTSIEHLEKKYLSEPGAYLNSNTI